jgi:hypothetical protein
LSLNSPIFHHPWYNNDCFAWGIPQCDKLNDELAVKHAINTTIEPATISIMTLMIESSD